jgi:DNA-directed RNA polymerase subunit beta'
MRNPAGKIIDFPVVRSHKEGLDVLEYFITTHGARKGQADTALRTSKAGYLTRKLADVAQDIVITEDDCGEKEGILVSRKNVESYGRKFSRRIYGRILSKDAGRFKKGHLLSIEDSKELDATGVEDVYVFSPITCLARVGICKKCYGYDIGSNTIIKTGEAVGIIAAQAIGEPGTQLTLRTFHLGGIAAGSDITMGLPRVEEVFELRMPHNPAVICETNGDVLAIKETDNEKIVVVDKKEYEIPFERTVIVKEGDKMKKGDLLTDGAVDIKSLYIIGGKEKTQNYVLNEISMVYAVQDAVINEKHIEVIVRQMFSRYMVKDSGDTNLNKGKILEKIELTEANELAEKEGGLPAKAVQLIMPISRVSLSTDSFLSAASFQDTARVLIRAATEGREDKLRGLKENVIIGRLIPAGTGFRKEYIQGKEADIEDN